MKTSVKKWIRFALRWGVAAAGIWWVVSNLTLYDRVWYLDENQRPVSARLARPAGEDAAEYMILDPATGEPRTVPASDVINSADADHKRLTIDGGDGTIRHVELLGMRLIGDINHNPKVAALLVASGPHSRGEWISPEQVQGGFTLHVPRPRVEPGLISMAAKANGWLLALAMAVMPLTFIITSYRWWQLCKALDIRMTLSRAFALNMVGAFYNTFLVGVTGGDLLKAYYASKQTPHRARAVMSVLVDRVIGLVALILLGGAMAAWQWVSLPAADPTARMCRRVALLCGLILLSMAGGLLVYFHPVTRRLFGLDFILKRLPMQHHVQSVLHVFESYRRKPLLVIWAILVSFPVHVVSIIGATLAGKAFGLPLSVGYYFVVVPVAVLVASVPISPQGAGVMEFFTFSLTEKQGATVAEALALTMSIRFLQILWNLTGGIFVLRGGYHTPSIEEARDLESQTDDCPAAPAAAPAG